jgi:hypothetical protein
MKKITAKFIADDHFDKSKLLAIKLIKQMNEYDEEEIKHDDFGSNYTFDFLIDSAKILVKGLFNVARGFAGMSMWAIVTIVEGLKYAFKFAFGKKEDGGKKNVKINVKVKN